MTKDLGFDNLLRSLGAARVWLAIFSVAAMLSASAGAQQLRSTGAASALETAQAQAPTAPKSQPPQPQAQPQRPAQPQAEGESHITKEEAEELFRSVDDILSFASKESHLPIKTPVKREMASRQKVRNYVTKHMEEDQDAQRLQRSAASLKKFGLVPRDFDLRAFLVNVLEDQVAGYYDSKTKTVYLLDWVGPEAQRPVLAHELTHALQDQSFDLERWLKVRPEAGNQPKPDLDDTTYDPEEEQAAREAVSEGQAMAVLVDFVLEPSGHTIAETPMMAEIFKQNTVERTNDSPVFAHAPLYLKESLIFSYTYGLGFVQTLLTKGGKDMAFSGAFKNPPHDTREIMEPKVYLASEHVPPLYLPRLSPVLKGKFEKYDLGEVGQFDVYILMKQFTGDDLAEKLSPAWRGGTYMLLRRASSPVAKGNAQPALSDLALVYLSRWVNAGDANRFVATYASWLSKKYKSVKAADTRSVAGITLDNNKWLTEDGPVFVEPHGDTVLVMEGFDDQTAGRIRDLVSTKPHAAVEPGPLSDMASRLRGLVHGFTLVH